MPKSPKPHRRRAARIVASVSHQPSKPQNFAVAELRARADGWTPARQRGFIEALAAGGCVEEACRAVGMSKQSAYRLRTRPEAQAFRLAWEAALDLGIRRLTDACLSRAIHGEEIPVFFQGQQIATRIRHDNKLAMFLLRYRDPLRYSAALDQMVHKGRPEDAAIGYAKALNRVADEAHGFVDHAPEEAEESPFPWSTIAIAKARAEAKLEELIDSDAPVHGSFDRQDRIWRERRNRAAAKRYKEQADPDWQGVFAEAQRRWDLLSDAQRKWKPRPSLSQQNGAWIELLDPACAAMADEAEAAAAAKAAEAQAEADAAATPATDHTPAIDVPAPGDAPVDGDTDPPSPMASSSSPSAGSGAGPGRYDPGYSIGLGGPAYVRIAVPQPLRQSEGRAPASRPAPAPSVKKLWKG